MKRSRVMAVIVAVAAAALVVGAATAAGPSPGTIVGFGGALSTDGKVRFVAVTSAHDTIVEKIDTRTGRDGDDGRGHAETLHLSSSYRWPSYTGRAGPVPGT